MDIKEWRNGIQLSINNGIQLYNDGIALKKTESYGHAIFSFVTALEEIAVAYYILERFDKPEPEGIKGFFNHKKKLSLSSLRSEVPRKYVNVIDYYELRKKQLKLEIEGKIDSQIEKRFFKIGDRARKSMSLWYLRNRGIYLSLNKEKSKFLSPNELNKKTTERIANFVYTQLVNIMIERDIYFKFGSESIEMKQLDLEIVKSMLNLVKLKEIILENSIDSLNDFQAVSKADKDFLIEFMLNPEKMEKEKPAIISRFLSVIFKELADAYKKTMEDPSLKQRYDFQSERRKIYNPTFNQVWKNVESMLIQISEETFKLENFNGFFNKDLSELKLFQDKS